MNYAVDPLETARSFAEAGAKWMHIVDLDGAKEGRPVQTELIASVIAEAGLKVEVGGGVRSTEDIRRLLDAGAGRVVVGTRAFEDWNWFRSLAHDPEFDRKLVLAIDAKEGVIATRGWTATSDRKAADVAAEVSDWPLGALLYTDVSKDGMLRGRTSNIRVPWRWLAGCRSSPAAAWGTSSIFISCGGFRCGARSWAAACMRGRWTSCAAIAAAASE